MRFWESVMSGPVAEQMMSGKKDRAEQLLDAALDQADHIATAGEVYLVGGRTG